MLSVFEEILSFEPEKTMNYKEAVRAEQLPPEIRYDAWLRERKVTVPMGDEWIEGELGDSCCFGTRTVQSGRENPWSITG
jgi:hypothetical protein